MKKSTAAIASLTVALVATNAWWAYQLLDSGVTLTYQQDSLRSAEEALAQTLEIIRVTSNPAATREQVVAAAARAAPNLFEPFEKEGHLWVGRLGLRFSEEGRLLEATSSPPHDEYEFDWERSAPLDLIATLQDESLRVFVIQSPHVGWVRIEHLPELIELLDSEAPCASVVLALSSHLPERSTVGNEAGYLISGYRAGRYPPTLSSDRPPLDRAEILEWWKAHSAAK